MLPVLFVQISAAVALVGTVTGFAAGIAQRRRALGEVHVVARKDPVRGTTILWVGGTLVATFWPLGFFLLPQFAYHWPAFPDFPASWVVQIIGVAFGVTGGVLFSRAARALGTQMTPEIRIQQGHQLIEVGPYRRIRHPVYTAILFVAFGQSLLFLSLPAALLALLLAALAVYRADLEERLLSSPDAFGATYDAYAARTGRFLPRLRSKP